MAFFRLRELQYSTVLLLLLAFVSFPSLLALGNGQRPEMKKLFFPLKKSFEFKYGFFKLREATKRYRTVAMGFCNGFTSFYGSPDIKMFRFLNAGKKILAPGSRKRPQKDDKTS